MPKITVGVPCYQYGHFMRECLESVLEQDFEDFELLLADNASTDCTPSLAAEFAERDPRVRSVRHPENLGYARNVNFLFEEARGELVTILGCDDRYLSPEALSTAVKALEEHPEAVFFSSAFGEVDEEGNLLRPVRYYEEAYCNPGREELCKYLALRGVWISSIVARTAEVRAIGGFDMNHEFAWDFGWFSRMAMRGHVCYSPKVLVTRRMHAASLAGSEKEADKLHSYDSLLQQLRTEIASDGELTAVVDRTLDLVRTQIAREEEGDATVPLQDKPEWSDLLDRWRRHGTRLLIYGAGMHTRTLMERSDFGGIEILGIADADEGLSGQSIQGVPVVPATRIEPMEPQAVLISSRRYEDEIYEDLRQRLDGGVELVRLYR